MDFTFSITNASFENGAPMCLNIKHVTIKKNTRLIVQIIKLSYSVLQDNDM